MHNYCGFFFLKKLTFCLIFFWKATQSFFDLKKLFGEETISKSQVERWFKSGKTNLADEEGRGRPSYFDDQILLAAV